MFGYTEWDMRGTRKKTHSGSFPNIQLEKVHIINGKLQSFANDLL